MRAYAHAIIGFSHCAHTLVCACDDETLCLTAVVQTNRPFIRARVGIPKRRQLLRKSIHRSLVLRTVGIGAVAASEKVGTTHHSS